MDFLLLEGSTLTISIWHFRLFKAVLMHFLKELGKTCPPGWNKFPTFSRTSDWVTPHFHYSLKEARTDISLLGLEHVGTTTLLLAGKSHATNITMMFSSLRLLVKKKMRAGDGLGESLVGRMGRMSPYYPQTSLKGEVSDRFCLHKIRAKREFWCPECS